MVGLQSRQYEKHSLQAQDLLQTAQAFLEQAEAAAFKDKKLSLQAFQALIQAGRHDPLNSDIPATLAYYFMGTGYPQFAFPAIQHALDLDPHHGVALQLENQLQQTLPYTEKWLSFEKLAAQSPPVEIDEFDELYDQVLDFAAQQLRYLQHATLEVSPTDSILQMQYYRLCVFLETIMLEKCEILAQEFEVGPVFRLIHPLEELKRHFLQEHTQNYQLFELDQRIEYVRLLILQLFQSLHAPNENIEQELDGIMLACEALTQDLDALQANETQGQLAPKYEEILSLVELLHETLDDFFE